MDADEAHVALQFLEKKRDLVKAENGVKNNCMAAKMVYVYEGKEKEHPHSSRMTLANCHYFCGGNGEEGNREFWDRIYHYLEQNYELEKIKKFI